MERRDIAFFHGGRVVHVTPKAPDKTLLEWLREEALLRGTKEGCAAGDCGACVVAVGERLVVDGEERLQVRAVNACLKLLASMDGCALWTVEDLEGGAGFVRDDATAALHPVQSAMVDAHGSQCGFCTPGFVMSLFALYHEQDERPEAVHVDRGTAVKSLQGNLCRCTGYRPILDAATTMGERPRWRIDPAPVLAGLRAIATEPPVSIEGEEGRVALPDSLASLVRRKAAHPEATLVAGGTDAVLAVTQGRERLRHVIGTTRVPELCEVRETPSALEIGAAVRLTDAFAAITRGRPAIAPYFERFAGPPVRNAGTLGGNVANASPIGDSAPVLLALGARLRIARWNGTEITFREVPMESFSTGYRTTVLGAGEVLTHVLVPLPSPTEIVRAYKLSKRVEDDISIVSLALRVEIEDGLARSIRIGCGGVAATPVRARRTEARLRHAPWDESNLRDAAAILHAEFSPLSDLRGSAGYRRDGLRALLLRAFDATKGADHEGIERFSDQQAVST